MSLLVPRIGQALSLLCALAIAPRTAVGQDGRGEAQTTQVRTAFSHALARLNGQRLMATVVEVVYAPGGSSAPHTHPCPVIGYVVEGALRTQLKGQSVAIYTAGESFYEAPNSEHIVSANASTEHPVRFLAYFTCDRMAELSVALPKATHKGAR